MDLSKFKPLLAVNADLSKLRFPVMVSPKIDGIRALMLNDKFLTRKLKPIPNIFIRNCLEKHAKFLEGSDGELVVGNSAGQGVFQRTSSGVMSEDGTPDFTYIIFDIVNDRPFEERWKSLRYLTGVVDRVVVLQQYNAHSVADINVFEERFISQGYEGVMLRDPNGRYKFGRSTVNEGILLKVKRFEDDEAVIVDFVERMHNINPAEKDELGNTKRSSHQENLIPAGTLGSLVVQSPKWSRSFNISLKIDDEQRQEMWNSRSKYLGKIAKFKYQPYGEKEVPRFGVFIGIRDGRDI